MPKKVVRRGRPPLRDTDRRKHIMSVRVRPQLHALLQEAAETNGRTLSQEVEFRIEQSFANTEIAAQIGALERKLRLMETTVRKAFAIDPTLQRGQPIEELDEEESK
jgi:hypothetical protein